MTICVIDNCNETGKTVTLKEIPGKPSFTLCTEHYWDFFWDRKREAREMATAIHEADPDMTHTSGYVYVIRLTDGSVKIGTTANPSMKRMKDITSRDNQGVPVHVLAVIKGGESLEALIHGQWSHLRVEGRMEQFHADPSLLQWAEQQGITPEVDDLEDWLVAKHNRGAVTSEEAREIQALIKQGIADSW
ncbi:GIY-YIG nuclease family protein [Streptomyces sp. NPDC004539]|uniref:GIY-YIG nuclease family protein n=1 Tax=Streptomyces sp. NPDC004539 TaxID=3154280 RepID=UPI0033A3B7B9